MLVKDVSIRELIDQKLRNLRWAQAMWDALKPTLELCPQDYVILFPSCNRETNLYGMKYLDTFLQRRDADKAVILTNDSFVKNRADQYSNNVKKIVCLEDEKLDFLVELYQFYIFEPNMVVISLDKPYCRNGTGLIGVKGTTIEQMIAIGVYGIIPFRSLRGREKIV